MKIITFQSDDLDLSFKKSEKIFADANRCNYMNAKPLYDKLFTDYNESYQTSYTSFFWGFANLQTQDLNAKICRAYDCIGQPNIKHKNVILLDISKRLCLKTDFYNFSDEIYAYKHPSELDSNWKSIYSPQPNRITQVIFPYITKSMIVDIIHSDKLKIILDNDV